MILAGDVGGTKTNLARFEPLSRGRTGPPLGARSYRSGDFPTFGALVTAYRRDEPGAVDVASFGVAGALVSDVVAGPNMPWPVEGKTLAAEIGIPRVHLINDLAATGYGLAALSPDSFRVLHPGHPAEDANLGLLAAGTGLGETILVRQGDGLVPIPSEGGHADFAPRTDPEILIFQALRQRFGRVSCERVLSGPGLVHVAEILHEAAGAAATWKQHLSEAAGGDPAEGVTARALAGSCPKCKEALEVFAGVYGAEAGNLALRGLTRGGVYLGGGIAPKILPALLGPVFREAFCAKEPLEPLLARIPVWVILEERTAMLGAARYATLV